MGYSPDSRPLPYRRAWTVLPDALSTYFLGSPPPSRAIEDHQAMRSSVVAITLLLVATPAWAGAREPGQADTAAIASALGNPAAQDALARTVDRLAGIVLDTRVGPLAVLTDARDDIEPDDTLRDVKEREDPDFESRLHRSTRRAAASAGNAAGAAVTQIAELRRTAERLKKVLGPALGRVSGDY